MALEEDANLGANIDEEAHVTGSGASHEKRRQNDDAQQEPRLTIVGAIQLLVGLVSNLFLLLSMAKRVRFSLALPITITGWYISAFCRASLSAAAARPALKAIEFPQNEIIWSQSFYYGIWAAILYFIDSSLLAFTLWGAITGYYQTEFILSIESWAYLDAVYWSVVTLFTVGFGDYYPTTDLGRALLIPYALTGMITLGLVISSVRSLVLEYGRRYITSRMDNRIRRKMIRTILRSSDDKTLEPILKEVKTSTTQSSNAPTTEFERRKTEFALMRKIQAKSSSYRRWVAMTISTLLWLILWLVGAVVFEKAEKPYQNWSYFDAFYFCFEAWTTIGYGDLAPISNAGRSFYVFWSLLALPTLTALLSHASDTVVRIIRDATILLGNLTILPNKGVFIGSMRHMISRITFGKAFPRYQNSISPEPSVSSANIDQPFPGIMAECYEQAPRDERVCTSASVVSQGVLQNSGPAPSTFAPGSRCNYRDGLPTATDFHFLLISEIQVIANHLKESKPHSYTFDQWAWYLRLIGEDENNPQTHCKVKLRGKHQGPDGEGQERGLKWSWVGNGSPLIGSQEESEWILGSLIDRLRESLLAERRRQLGTSAEVVHQEAQDLQGFHGGCGVEKPR